jgi:hypothetical protein
MGGKCCWTLTCDDSLLYLGIDYIDDCNQLQKDLDKLVNWASEWQMKFNGSKCYILRITNKKKPVTNFRRSRMCGTTSKALWGENVVGL